jgi:hypothetical protein
MRYLIEVDSTPAAMFVNFEDAYRYSQARHARRDTLIVRMIDTQDNETVVILTNTKKV